MKPNENKKPTPDAEQAEGATQPSPETTAVEGTTGTESQSKSTADGAAAPDTSGKAKPKRKRSKKRKSKAASKPQPRTAPVLTSADVETVQLGPVTGRRQKVPVDVVCGILGQTMLERVEALRGHPTTESVRERMLATDGRATPVVFSAGSSENEPPALLSGVEAVAVALDTGIEQVFVIVVAAEDVGAAQSHLVEMARQPKPEDSEDDLYVRVLATDDE